MECICGGQQSIVSPTDSCQKLSWSNLVKYLIGFNILLYMNIGPTDRILGSTEHWVDGITEVHEPRGIHQTRQ